MCIEDIVNLIPSLEIFFYYISRSDNQENGAGDKRYDPVITFANFLLLSFSTLLLQRESVLLASKKLSCRAERSSAFKLIGISVQLCICFFRTARKKS